MQRHWVVFWFVALFIGPWGLATAAVEAPPALWDAFSNARHAIEPNGAEASAVNLRTEHLGSGAQMVELAGSATEMVRYMDFGGLDTYTLLPGLAGSVSVVDNQASVIHLPAGLTIDGALFASDGVRFTINSHVVTLLGHPADFTFVFAGTPSDPSAGLSLNFEETAAVFGASVPASGTLLVAGTLFGTIDADGYLIQGVSDGFPASITLVSASSLQRDSIQFDWLTAFDFTTSSNTNLQYTLHASQDSGFVPDGSTAYTTVSNTNTGSITGLQADTLYYLKVEAIDDQGQRGWSNELSVVTAASDPIASSEPRQVLDAPDQTVTTDSIDYRLPTGQAPPEVGDLLFSANGDGYLRRATAVSQTGDQISIQTDPAALNEAFDDVRISTELKLIDVPEVQNATASRSSGQVASGQTGNRRQITWPDSGLTLIQEDQTPTGVFAAAQRFSAARSTQQTTKTDAPLEVRYPRARSVEPGQTLEIDITAAIQSGYGDQYAITQLHFLGLSHSKMSAQSANYGATWTPAAISGATDTAGTGTMTWTPSDRNVDTERAYTATFKAIAKEREANCSGFFEWCDTKTVEVEISILVASGEWSEKRTDEVITKTEGSLTLSATAGIDFQPTLRADVAIANGDLTQGEVMLTGPIAFTTKLQLQASGSGLVTARKEIYNKHFARLFMVGQVPVLMSGRLKLDVQASANVSAALDLTQTLGEFRETRYQLERLVCACKLLPSGGGSLHPETLV